MTAGGAIGVLALACAWAVLFFVASRAVRRFSDRGAVRSILAVGVLWAASLYVLAFSAEALSGGRRIDPASPFARWDSPWYARIARSGYEGRADGQMHDIAFFPLY
ncbi:MAG: hypothetical protein ACRD16_09690, partial [Thermoanaerobaculia bacterium]